MILTKEELLHWLCGIFHRLIAWGILKPKGLRAHAMVGFGWMQERRRSAMSPIRCITVKDFDAKYQEFHEDPRNVRFALSTDGMNPFGDRTSTHSTWSVILFLYNLPPLLCQNRKYWLLTIIISGPKAPGIDIDAFLIDARNGDTMEAWSENVGWACEE